MTYLVTSSQYTGLGTFNSVAMLTQAPSRLEALTTLLRNYAGASNSSPLHTSNADPKGRQGANKDVAKVAFKEGIHATYEIEDLLVLATDTESSEFLVLGGESLGLSDPLEIRIHENPLNAPLDITRNCRATL